MQGYLELLKTVLSKGEKRDDRTGVGTLSVFGVQTRYCLSEGFPMLTTKKLHFKSIAHELLWFLRGDTNVDYLQRHGVNIWNEWADENGDLGRIYGAQWRSWQSPDGKCVDQIQRVIRGLRDRPYDRRHIVSAWNPGELGEMTLPPCHVLFQFFVSGDRRLSCQLYQRSADLFLGVPFNIASYALLVHIVARFTDLEVGDLIHTFGDLHLYVNHEQQAKEQLMRTPRTLPTLRLDPALTCLDDLVFEHLNLCDYDPYPHIPAPVAV